MSEPRVGWTIIQNITITIKHEDHQIVAATTIDSSLLKYVTNQEQLLFKCNQLLLKLADTQWHQP